MKATAIANSNIAFVKYWGKKDALFNIPMNPSISMTLDDNFSSTTTVEFSDKYIEDIFILNNEKQIGSKLVRVTDFLDFVRKIAKTDEYAKVVSINKFPTASGIASSASGFAALAVTCNYALSLNLTLQQLSGLARQGSGSAARSIYGGFVFWKDEYAVQLKNKDYWNLRDVVVILSQKEKSVSSREAMQSTVEKSHLYKKRLQNINLTLNNVKAAINTKNFKLLAKDIMKDSDEMHACIQETGLNYLNNDSNNIKNLIKDMNKDKIKAAYTFDAGPNAHIITLQKNLAEIKEALINYDNIIISKPGHGVRKSNNHLF